MITVLVGIVTLGEIIRGMETTHSNRINGLAGFDAGAAVVGIAANVGTMVEMAGLVVVGVGCHGCVVLQ